MSRALGSGSVSQSTGALGTKRWLQVHRKFLKSSQPPGSQQETGSHILVTRVEGSPSFSPSAVAAGLGASVSPRHGHALSASQVRSVNVAGSSPAAEAVPDCQHPAWSSTWEPRPGPPAQVEGETAAPRPSPAGFPCPQPCLEHGPLQQVRGGAVGGGSVFEPG